MARRIFLLLFLLGLGIVDCATIRRGHVWSDDLALYISLLATLLLVIPMGKRAYIDNPSIVNYSPRGYPPIFLLLLVPLYKLFGLNLSQ